MAEESIDFTQSSRRILLNPIVPLSMLDIACRTSDRAQATLLGKVYSGHIEIVEVIPMQYTNSLKIDYQEHQRKLESIQQIYPSLEVVGAVLTDIDVNSLQIPTLHSVYINKDSGFKTQGILTTPIIMSMGKSIKEGDFKIEAYSFNSVFKFCHELMGISAFEQWIIKISFGETKVQEISPIYTALRDQEEYLPTGSLKEIIDSMVKNLKAIRKHVSHIIANHEPSDTQLGVALKKILSFNSLSKEDLNKITQKGALDTKLIVYLSSVVSAQNLLAEKLNKLS